MASRAEAWKPTGPIGASTIESLYELHAPRLRRQCLRLTADAAAADDLMQEVFVRFMTRFPDPPAGMNVGAYLHRTARNVLWNQRRDAHEVLVDDLETRLGADDQLERDPERAALLVEQRHLVRRCATLLTRRQRRALTLRDVDGQSYAEIGSELGIGADAVAQVISRARMRLRSVVRREQADLDELQPECRAMLGPPRTTSTAAPPRARRRSRLTSPGANAAATRSRPTRKPACDCEAARRWCRSPACLPASARWFEEEGTVPSASRPPRRSRPPPHLPSVAAACSSRSD